jgi:homeobox protein cut-like
MEAGLRERARKFQGEALALRRALDDSNEELTRAHEAADDARRQAGEAAKLAAKLEEDLRVANGVGKGGAAGADGEGGAGAPGGEQNGEHGSSASMLDVVVAQRERFKAKAEKAEADLAELQAALEKEKGRTAKAKKDNVALYEKVRYLESYGTRSASMERGGGGAPALAGARRGPLAQCLPQRAADLEAGAAADTPEGRAAADYRAKMDPFAQFTERERVNAARRLRLHDRIALSSGRFLSTHAFARAFVVFYLLALHVFVAFVMMHEVGEHSAYYDTTGAELPSQQAVLMQNANAANAVGDGAGGASAGVLGA